MQRCQTYYGISRISYDAVTWQCRLHLNRAIIQYKFNGVAGDAKIVLG